MTTTRRRFLTLATGIAALPLLATRAAIAAPAQSTPQAVQALIDAGKPVVVVFRASWCSTCAAQEKVINAILADDPAIENTVTIALLDWDTYQDDAFTKALNIPRRSTLVRISGGRETGRLVAQTDRAQIEALLRG